MCTFVDVLCQVVISSLSVHWPVIHQPHYPEWSNLGFRVKTQGKNDLANLKKILEIDPGWCDDLTQNDPFKSQIIGFMYVTLYRFRKKYSNRSKKWTVQPIVEPARYSYIPDLMEIMFPKRQWTLGHLSQHVSLSEEDPKRISSTIAKVPAPSYEKLVAERMENMQMPTWFLVVLFSVWNSGT